MFSTAARNLLIALGLIALLVGTGSFMNYGQPLGAIAIAFTLYFIAETLRNSIAFNWLGPPEVHSLPEIFESRQMMGSFLLRKSTWIVVPLSYAALSPAADLAHFGLIPDSFGAVQLILLAVLGVFSLLMFMDAKGMAITVTAYFKAFGHALLAAGLPEDLLVIGVIGGRVLRLFSVYLAPWAAKALTVALVESLFCLSHIPSVRGAKDFYSEHMTLGRGMSYRRMFLQMFIISLPGWLFYFLSSHIYFSVWWHSLVDIAAFLPKDNRRALHEQAEEVSL